MTDTANAHACFRPRIFRRHIDFTPLPRLTFESRARSSMKVAARVTGTNLARRQHTIRHPGFGTFGMTAQTITDRRRVLVVDDEPYIGRIIQLKLESAPYDVELIHDGRVALERLRSPDPVDLILLDIMMPHMSGLEVLAELRRLPHRADTPVIMLTAKGHETDREQAARLGASDFLTKPFSPKKLLARIEELFTP